MNPIEKWQAKRRFPYKLLVQVIKIVLVTVQLCLFAHNNYMHVNYAWDNRIAFSHLFLNGWDATLEVSILTYNLIIFKNLFTIFLGKIYVKKNITLSK